MFLEHINIDDAFREQLNDYEQTPPEDVWNNIEQSLHQGKKLEWKKYAQIAALLLLIVAIGGLVVFQNVSFYNTQIETLVFEQSDGQSGTKGESLYQVTSVGGNSDFTGNHPVIQIPGEKQLANLAIAELQDDMNQTARNLIAITDMRALTSRITGISEDQYHEQQKEYTKTDIPTSQKQTFDEFPALASLNFTKEKQNDIKLKGSFSPTISYRNTNNSQVNSSVVDERSLIAYSGGLNLSYNLTEKLTVSSGVFYSQMGQTLNDVQITADSYIQGGPDALVRINTSMGTNEMRPDELKSPTEPTDVNMPSRPNNGYQPDAIIYDEFSVENTLLQKLEFVKIPVLFEYKLVDKNIGISMVSGVNTNLLVNEGIYMQNDLEMNKVGAVKDINRVTYSGTFGLGVDYEINRHIQLSMQPLFDYFLTSFNSGPGKTFPYSFGLYTGLSVSF